MLVDFDYSQEQSSVNALSFRIIALQLLGPLGMGQICVGW